MSQATRTPSRRALSMMASSRCARAGDRSFYGLDGLCAAIEKNRAMPVEELREAVMRDVLSWSPVPEDDMTLMVMRYEGKPVAG